MKSISYDALRRIYSMAVVYTEHSKDEDAEEDKKAVQDFFELLTQGFNENDKFVLLNVSDAGRKPKGDTSRENGKKGGRPRKTDK